MRRAFFNRYMSNVRGNNGEGQAKQIVAGRARIRAHPTSMYKHTRIERLIAKLAIMPQILRNL